MLHSVRVALLAATCALVSAPVLAEFSPEPTLAPNKGKKPTIDKEQFAYSIGYLNGQDSLQRTPDLDVKTFMQGFKDAMERKESLLTQEESTTALNRYKAQRQAQFEADMQRLSVENEKISRKFFFDNAQQADIKTTASGLQYRVIKMGDGRKPKANDTVKVHYIGAFLDGRVFDSSVGRDEPATLKANEVIAGWTEALQLMPTGSEFEIFVPANLAYGDKGAGPIAPNAALKFKINLISIEKPKKK